MTKALISIDYSYDFVADDGKLTAGKPAQAIEDRIAQVTQEAYDNGEAFATDDCLGLLEEYLKRVEFQKTYKKVGEVYNREGLENAQQLLAKHVDWTRTFSLTESTYTDVIDTFTTRHIQNRAKNNARGAIRAITRFYIDELYNLNQD